MADYFPKDHKFEAKIPEGDDHERMVCTDCGFVHYENPKIVAGAVVTYGNKILLCRRAINPRAGFWTIPAGFMELGETPAEAAVREAREEANAHIKIVDLLAIYTIKRISQVQMMYRAELIDPDISPGIESLEVALFDRADIPHDDLAFPSVDWALAQSGEIGGADLYQPFTNPPEFAHV